VKRLKKRDLGHSQPLGGGSGLAGCTSRCATPLWLADGGLTLTRERSRPRLTWRGGESTTPQRYSYRQP
jgi:hypothetical protein